MSLFERLIVYLWNATVARKRSRRGDSGLTLGSIVRDGRPTNSTFGLSDSKALEHTHYTGRTGSGKSSALMNTARHSWLKNEGLYTIAFHDDIPEYILGTVADIERRTGLDLSTRLCVIAPGDPTYSVGLDLLQAQNDGERFLLAAEIAQIMSEMYSDLGARTEEVLRNSIISLSTCRLPLIDIVPFLSNAQFRNRCLQRVTNSDVRFYFEQRYNAASDAMQAAMRDPILNRLGVFTTDPRFRHMLGQQDPRFSLESALDNGMWTVLWLSKSKLRETAGQLSALFIPRLKNAVFARKSRRIVRCIFDEAPNIIRAVSGLDVMYSEFRKFGAAVVTSAQSLEQFPPTVRAAMLSIGTHVCFQLSAPDAEKMASAFDGGKMLAERLKNLPRRHAIVKSGSSRYEEILIPEVRRPHTDYSDLYRRCQERWGQRRADVEAQIVARQATPVPVALGEVLDAWE